MKLACSLIKRFEGLSLKAYKCPADVWTIGYGNTSYLKGYTKPETKIITQEIADELLQNDMQIYYNCVIKNVGEICNQSQIAALISFCFNIGVGAFKSSTLLKTIKHNPNNMPEIQTQFMKWVYGGGKVLPGLVKRREEEFRAYSTS